MTQRFDFGNIFNEVIRFLVLSGSLCYNEFTDSFLSFGLLLNRDMLHRRSRAMVARGFLGIDDYGSFLGD